MSDVTLEETEAQYVPPTATAVEIAAIEKLGEEDLEHGGRATPRQAGAEDDPAVVDDHRGGAALLRGASKAGPEVANQNLVTMLHAALLVSAEAAAASSANPRVQRVQRIQRETPTLWLHWTLWTLWTRWTGLGLVMVLPSQEVSHGQ